MNKIIESMNLFIEKMNRFNKTSSQVNDISSKPTRAKLCLCSVERLSLVRCMW